jgi:hypothetical protein
LVPAPDEAVNGLFLESPDSSNSVFLPFFPIDVVVTIENIARDYLGVNTLSGRIFSDEHKTTLILSELTSLTGC